MLCVLSGLIPAACDCSVGPASLRANYYFHGSRAPFTRWAFVVWGIDAPLLTQHACAHAPCLHAKTCTLQAKPVDEARHPWIHKLAVEPAFSMARLSSSKIKLWDLLCFQGLLQYDWELRRPSLQWRQVICTSCPSCMHACHWQYSPTLLAQADLQVEPEPRQARAQGEAACGRRHGAAAAVARRPFHAGGRGVRPLESLAMRSHLCSAPDRPHCTGRSAVATQMCMWSGGTATSPCPRWRSSCR